MHKIGVMVGSLRAASINGRLAHAIAKLGADRFEFSFVELGTLPLYNEDLWASPPPGVLAMKEAVAAADGVLMVSPEYNRSVSPVLKNAIDWGSRPWGQNSWKDKPVAVAGASLGVIGTAAAQAHVRNSLIVLDALLLGQPEIYLAFKDSMLDENGEFAEDPLKTLMNGFLDRFSAWIDRVG